MADELRFDGRVAIVTGAGGVPSLGRAHAMLLAKRGARVVVNDVGTVHAPETGSAGTVAREIVAAGGIAVADTNSVATEDGAAAIVRTAIEAFGGIDIVVNNAGVALNAEFDVIEPRDFRRTLDVNLLGPIWVTRAAWPHMKARRYGRVVNITSGSAAGMTRTSAYVASKGGLYGLTRALAADGRDLGILVNSVSPTAFTRMVAAGVDETSPALGYIRAMAPEAVSPAVAFLAHESCTVTGECLDVGGGAVRRLYWAMTDGIVDPDLTPEAVAARWDEIAAGTAAGRVDIVAGEGGVVHRPYEPSTAE